MKVLVDHLTVPLVGQRGRKIMKFLLLSGLSRLGWRRSFAASALDLEIEPYLAGVPRVFVEAGANDGISQSNTYDLERRLHWDGILVEPLPPLAGLCRRFRRVPTVNVALGAFEDDGGEIEIPFEDLMSSAVHVTAAQPRFRNWAGLFGTNLYGQKFKCRVVALSKLLDSYGYEEVGLLSLDVEGYALPVLRGVDFARHRIHVVLIETNQVDAVAAHLPNHRLIGSLSHRDYLFVLK